MSDVVQLDGEGASIALSGDGATIQLILREGGGGGAVDSVNGQTGTVVLDAGDVGAAAASHTHGAADIASGTIASARLGSGGTGGGAKFLADDQTFKTVSASETLPVSIIDAKGDLIVGTGADTAARLPVGAPNGSPLVVDSYELTGVRWAASEAVFAGCPPAATNDWTLLSSPFGTGTTGATNFESSTAATNGSARLLPVTVTREVSVTGLGIEVTAGNSGASAVLRLGLFTSVAGRPGAPVVDVTAGIATTGAKELAVSSVTIQAGTYWAVIVCQELDVGGTNPRVRTCSSLSSSAPRTVVPSGAYQGTSWGASISGALSSSPTVTSTSGFVPQIWMKASW